MNVERWRGGIFVALFYLNPPGYAPAHLFDLVNQTESKDGLGRRRGVVILHSTSVLRIRTSGKLRVRIRILRKYGSGFREYADPDPTSNFTKM